MVRGSAGQEIATGLLEDGGVTGDKVPKNGKGGLEEIVERSRK